MEIVPVQAKHVEQLLAIYLAQVAHAPHCRLQPDLDQFAKDLLTPDWQPTRLQPAPSQTQTFVAEASGQALGCATLVTYSDGGKEQQAITGLFFSEPAVGNALIQTCEEAATTDALKAFPNTHGNTLIQAYNGGWDGLSDQISGTANLLTQAGYTPYFRELHLYRSLNRSQLTWLAATSSVAGVRMVIPEVPPEYRGAVPVQAMVGDQEIGICSWSTLSLLTGEPMAGQIGYIWWLHVDRTYRRHGIAHALMTTAFEQLLNAGCTDCWLTTTADNWAAQAFYYRLGFRVVDTSVSFRKKLH